MPPSSRHADSGSRQPALSATFIPAPTLLIVAWGAFAFGAVYSWAYTPLAIACALVGLLGLVAGRRPVWTPNRRLLLALMGIGLVGAVQLVPLPISLLTTISPGTASFLANFDLRFSLGADPTGETATVALRHAISVAPERTVLFLLLLAAALVFFVGLLRTLSRTATLRLARGIVFIGCVLSIVGVVQKAMLGDHAFGGMKIYGFWQPDFLLTTPFGPYVNKNHFAGWMLMAIPLALGLARGHAGGESGGPPDLKFRHVLVWLSEPEGGRMLLYLVAALIMALALLTTGSRSGLGCFAVVVCGAAIWTSRRGSTRMVIGAGVGALVLVLIALQWAGSDAALERFAHDPESMSFRLSIWSVSVGMLRHFPLLGTGLDAFGTATTLYEPSGIDMHYNEAHNDYLQLLVEGGLVTFALVLAAIVSAARAVAVRFRANDDGPHAYWVRVGASAGLVAIALQSLVEFSLQMPGNAVLFVVLLAMALHVPAQLRQHHDDEQPLGPPA